MTITATIARGYAWRMIIIGVVCAVLGVWGVYDYAIKIPRNQRLSNHRELLELCQAALQTEQSIAELSPEAKAANAAIDEELTRIISGELEKQRLASEIAGQPGGPPPQLNIESSEDGAWVQLLLQIKQGLTTERRLPLSEEDYPQAYAAYQVTQANIDEIGEVIAPGKYDRVTQWAFMLCLPFAPYFFWLYVAARRQIYRMDDDGTLHMPEGTWKREEVADIDMKRWMAKSIAWVVHQDGTRVKLDDYKYRNLHRIIGLIAHRFYPKEFDEEARPVKSAQPQPEASTAEADRPQPQPAASPADSRSSVAEGAE